MWSKLKQEEHFESEITVHLGDDDGNSYKSCKLTGKTIKNVNEVLGWVPREIICR